jgi:hypothetical protein
VAQRQGRRGGRGSTEAFSANGGAERKGGAAFLLLRHGAAGQPGGVDLLRLDALRLHLCAVEKWGLRAVARAREEDEVFIPPPL